MSATRFVCALGCLYGQPPSVQVFAIVLCDCCTELEGEAGTNMCVNLRIVNECNCVSVLRCIVEFV